MGELIAERIFYSPRNCILILRSKAGKIVKQYNTILQPSKRQKYITLQGQKYIINWQSAENKR